MKKTIKNLIGKKFKNIIDSEYGGIKIEFEDETIAYFECDTFPDGTIDEIHLESIIKKRDEWK